MASRKQWQDDSITVETSSAVITRQAAPRELQTKAIAETLIERVNKLVQEVDRPIGWGHPRSSVTPRGLAIDDLASRTEALERAVRELAHEVQKLTARTPA